MHSVGSVANVYTKRLIELNSNFVEQCVDKAEMCGRRLSRTLYLIAFNFLSLVSHDCGILHMM